MKDFMLELALECPKTFKFVEDIRVSMEVHGYTKNAQYELNFLHCQLQKSQYPTLATKLRQFIDSLGEPI